MGQCILCGESAGWFHSEHPECVARRDRALRSMIELAAEAIRVPGEREQLESKLQALAANDFVHVDQIQEAMIAAWEAAVSEALEDSVLTKEEEQQLVGFQKHFSISQGAIDRKGALSSLVKAATLRDLMEGTLPNRIEIEGRLSINLQKSESVIWLFAATERYEDRTRRQYVGSYQGVSVRVAKGIYWRTGGFRGHPVERNERVHVDTGLLAVTNKHVYFVGAKKSLRIPYQKIIALIPFSDGVGIHRDGATAKPQIFVTGDGWFTYNLLANIKNID